MKRPNKYSTPLSGDRKCSYHPADINGNSSANDLNTYIDYLEKQLQSVYTEQEVLDLLKRRSFDLKHKKCTKTASEWFQQFKKQ